MMEWSLNEYTHDFNLIPTGNLWTPSFLQGTPVQTTVLPHNKVWEYDFLEATEAGPPVYFPNKRDMATTHEPKIEIGK